jgi:hypothetical protein
VKYYVPVGRGGVFFRIGMVVTRTMGSLVYWRASCRRSAEIQTGRRLSFGHTESVVRRRETSRGIVAASSSRAEATAGIERGRHTSGCLISQ